MLYEIIKSCEYVDNLLDIPTETSTSNERIMIIKCDKEVNIVKNMQEEICLRNSYGTNIKIRKFI